MMVWFLLKGSFMKKLTNKEMMMVNGGDTCLGGNGDYELWMNDLGIIYPKKIDPVEIVVVADKP